MDRVPALVAISPPDVGGAGLPVASISYGFRGYESVDQAVRDANYEGKTPRLPPLASARRQAAGGSPAAGARSLDRVSLIEDYLRDESRRAPAPAGRLQRRRRRRPMRRPGPHLAVARDGRIASATFDAEGCAASARAAAAAATELVEGTEVLDAARIGPADIADALGGLTPQGAHAADLAADALAPRARRGRRIRRAAAAPPAGRRARRRRDLSGGVDSAVAALLERERGADVVAVTVKLWADRHNDGERSCCSPQAVLGARALAHSLGIPHLTLDLEDALPLDRGRRLHRRLRAGRTPNPCVLCNGEVRIDAMLALADRLGARSARHRPLRPRSPTTARARCSRAPADHAKDQTYMLSALGRDDARPAALPARRPDQARGARDRRRGRACRSPPRPRARTSASSRARASARFLARHGGLAERPGEIVDADGRGARHPPRPPPLHRRPAPGPRRRRAPSRSSSSRPTPTPTGSWSARASELATDRVRVRDATLHRPGGRVDRVRLRYRSRPIACRSTHGRRRRSTTSSTIELDEPAYGVAPGPDRVPDGRRPGGRPRHDRGLELGPRPRLAHRREDRRDPRDLPVASSRSGGTCACPRRR